MTDRDEDEARIEALEKAREVLRIMGEEVSPTLDELVPVGGGDRESALPNSLRLLVHAFDAADARDELTRGGALSARTVDRIAAGERAPRSTEPVIAAVVRAVAQLGRGQGEREVVIHDFEALAPDALREAAQRWDALATAVGTMLSPANAASIVLRYVAVDVGVRLAALRVAGVTGPPWLLFESVPIGYAIDTLVLPAFGLSIGDVQTELDVQERTRTHRWARSTLARWRLEGAIPERGQLEAFVADLCEVARDRTGQPVDPMKVRRARWTLRAARAAARLRRTVEEAFPGGVGERLMRDFVAAVKLVSEDAFEVLSGDALLLAWAVAQTIVPPGEMVLMDPETGLPTEQPAGSEADRANAVTLVRHVALAGLAQGDSTTIAQVRKAATRSLIALGAAAPEAIAVSQWIAQRLPPSGVRITVERLARDPRRAILSEALVVALLEQIAERAGDKRSAMLHKAAECAAILGGSS